LFATAGTWRFLRAHGIEAERVNKIHEGAPTLLDLIQGGRLDMLINTTSKDRVVEREGALIRRASVERGVPCLTSLDTARALLLGLEARRSGDTMEVRTVDEYLGAE
jgi:carbamoyl-phosphate synthase large subunit